LVNKPLDSRNSFFLSPQKIMMQALSPDISHSNMLQIRRNVLISGAFFLGALALALSPGSFDRPLLGLVNSLAGRSALFDGVVYAVSRYFTFSGAVLMALIWCCWFDSEEPDSRARILVGVFASFVAGVISRSLQHTLPTHPRPVYDPALNFQVPPGFEQQYHTWNSFPSDHAAVFAGLAVVIYLVRSRFALFAIVWTALVESARVYVGAHYFSDLIGGAALAAAVIWATQASWLIVLGRRVVKWERIFPSLFYMTAFFISYQIVTLFEDVRHALGPFFDLLRR
jgi:membrane-associated phospholipid phosphatase